MIWALTRYKVKQSTNAKCVPKPFHIYYSGRGVTAEVNPGFNSSFLMDGRTKSFLRVYHKHLQAKCSPNIVLMSVTNLYYEAMKYKRTKSDIFGIFINLVIIMNLMSLLRAWGVTTESARLRFAEQRNVSTYVCDYVYVLSVLISERPPSCYAEVAISTFAAADDLVRDAVVPRVHEVSANLRTRKWQLRYFIFVLDFKCDFKLKKKNMCIIQDVAK